MRADLMAHFLRSAIMIVTVTLGFAGPAASQDPTNRDLQALRYYYEQENDDSVRAELRRLMLQFPTWTPPDDVGNIFSTSGPQRIDEIYRLIEQGDHEAARALIAEANAAFPEWVPPTAMLELLSLSEAQAAFDLAVQAGDAATVISIVRGVPNLLSCERVNNAWELANAHLKSGDTNAALATYRAVLKTCNATDTLIATLEKSAAIAPLNTLSEFSDIAQGQAPSSRAEIRLTEDRLRAGRQDPPRWGNGENVIAVESPNATPYVAPVGVPDTRPVARPERQSATPVISSAPAQVSARAVSPAPSTGGGGLSAIQSASQRGAWAECLALSAGSTRADVLAQRGWCAYNANRSLEAMDAFQEAARRGTTASTRRDATYGLLLSMLRLNMTEQAAQVAAAAPLTHSQRVEVEGQILDQRGVRAYNTGQYARAIAFFKAHEGLTGTTRRDLALLHGYALLNMGDRAGAQAVFERLHRQLSTTETRKALRSLD